MTGHTTLAASEPFLSSARARLLELRQEAHHTMRAEEIHHAVDRLGTLA